MNLYSLRLSWLFWGIFGRRCLLLLYDLRERRSSRAGRRRTKITNNIIYINIYFYTSIWVRAWGFVAFAVVAVFAVVVAVVVAK